MKSKFIVCLVVLNLLFFLHTSSCLAANPYRIALKNVPMSVTNDHFYVKTVIDGRMDKSSLGTVQCGIFNKKVPADFKGDFINVIQSYLETTFKMAETKVPIVVKINILRVVEEEAIEGEISRAEAKMAFYKMNEAKLGKVYETEAYVEKLGLDVTKYHEKNIRSVLERCFQSFAVSNWETVEPAWEDLQTVEESKAEESILTIAVPVRKKICLMEPFAGQNGKGESISLYGYDPNESGWQIKPAIYFYEVIYSSYKPETYCINLSGPAVTFYRKFSNSNWGIMFEGGMPLGLVETAKEVRGYFTYTSYETKFNVDLKFQERLIYISEAEPYFVCSIGAYQRSSLLNPDFYPWDIGLTISVGTQF